MSIGILTLKIGLVATVTGASIATPILLNRSSGVSSSVTSQNSATEGVGGQGDIATRSTSDQLVQRREDSAVDSGRSMGMVTTEEQDRESQISPAPLTVPEGDLSRAESDRDTAGDSSERGVDGQSVHGEDSVQSTGSSNGSLSPSTTSLTSEVSHPET